MSATIAPAADNTGPKSGMIIISQPNFLAKFTILIPEAPPPDIKTDLLGLRPW